jgi:hypothetical protein
MTCVHDVAMHEVGVHDVGVDSVCMHGMGVPGVGVHKMFNFSDAHLKEKTPIFSYYVSLNKVFQIKRWSLIVNKKRPCLHILKGRPLN